MSAQLLDRAKAAAEKVKEEVATPVRQQPLLNCKTSLLVGMYVMYVYVFIYTYTYMYVCMYVCMYVYIYAYN
jgi:hypothetical protein